MGTNNLCAAMPAWLNARQGSLVGSGMNGVKSVCQGVKCKAC